MINGICELCGVEFKYYLSTQRGKKKRFCSKKCQFEFKVPIWNTGMRIYKNCVGCGVQVRKWKKYCSRQCFRQNVDWSNSKYKNNSGTNNPMWGKKYSPERLEKMKQFMLLNPQRYWKGKRRESMNGDKHWNWKGGVSDKRRKFATIEYKLWRTSVFERDKYVCQDCGAFCVALNAHHIKRWVDYPEFRYAIDNGVTLCVKCHHIRHRKNK